MSSLEYNVLKVGMLNQSAHSLSIWYTHTYIHTHRHARTHTYTQHRLTTQPFVRDYPDKPVPEETYTHSLQLQPFNGLFSRTTWVSRYQKGKTNLDFTVARDGEWQWHQVCTSLQTDNHASTPPLCFLQAGCPSCHPTNSVKALKALYTHSLSMW